MTSRSVLIWEIESYENYEKVSVVNRSGEIVPDYVVEESRKRTSYGTFYRVSINLCISETVVETTGLTKLTITVETVLVNISLAS